MCDRSIAGSYQDDKDDKDDSSSGSSDTEEQAKGVFTVEGIKGKRMVKGKPYYLIKWKGWKDSANTWEPVENMGGCSKLLEEFEKHYAEKKILAPKRRLSGRHPRKNSFCDRDDDKDATLGKTRKNMKYYGVSGHWPAERQPISVEGVISVNGVLTYVVKKNTRTGSENLDRTNAVLVHADAFRLTYPQLVIQFYERRIVFCEDDKDETEKANVAAQMALLKSNRGSKIGDEIAKDVDLVVSKNYKKR